MSDEKHDHDEYTNELARQQNIRFGTSRVLKALGIEQDARFTREEVVDDLLKDIQQEYDLRPSDKGWVEAYTHTGEKQKFEEIVKERFLASRLVEQSSVTAAVSNGSLEIKAKSDLRTPKDKVAYVAKHGLEAFEKLPLRRVVGFDRRDTANMTRKQYDDLTTGEKAKLISDGLLNDKTITEIMRRR
jgi:hypothetical protein